MKTAIRVLLADDHMLFRQGLRRILDLETDIVVVAEVSTGEETVSYALEHTPDVVLMDINMPGMSGVEATKLIKLGNPKIKVIILSIHDDEGYVFETIRVGADGYILKDVDAHVLIDAVRAVAAGSAFMHPKITGKLISEFQRLSALTQRDRAFGGRSEAGGALETGTSHDPLHELLTQRELEILKAIAEGKSNRGIAESFYISEKTVKNHVSSILAKLGVEDRTQAVILAAKRGWIRL
jgi:two-component system response regulator DegU